MAVSAKIEQVKADLRRDLKGSNLYDHLCAIIGKLIEEDPEDALQSFEALSAYVKDGKFAGAEGPDWVVPFGGNEEFQAKQYRWIKCLQEYKVAMENPQRSLNSECQFPDMVKEADMFNWAGVGLGQQEMHQIHLSLRRLVHSVSGMQEMRFWGKILGTESDYLVAEGVPVGRAPVDEAFPEREPRGSGINSCVYFVAKDPCSEWTALPDCQPGHLLAARKVKKLFTGDLDRMVVTNPWFPGQERDLLRAQIARISSATVICPSGMLEWDEEANEAKPLEFTVPGVGELASPEGWVHRSRAVLANGRTAYPEVDEENEPELFKDVEAMREADPAPDALRSLDQDEPLPAGVPAWNIRSIGDPATYSFGDESKAYGFVVLRSAYWPGAAAVAQSGSFQNIYVGYGTKAGAPAFLPGAPAEVMGEPDDLEEFPEPYPREEDIASDGGSQVENPEEEAEG